MIYVLGTHDEFLPKHVGAQFRGKEVYGAAGRKRYFLALHYCADWAVINSRRPALLGHHACALSAAINHCSFRVPRQKHTMTNAADHGGEFPRAEVARTCQLNYDGVICDHLANRDIGGVRIINCGDWSEHGAMAAETQSGEFEVIGWIPSYRSAGASQARAA